MKILFIGYLREMAGYSEASRNDIKTLSKKYDVCCRSIDLKSDHKDEFIEFLCSKSVDNIDCVIQHTLPSDFETYPNVKNIGYFETESLNLSNSYWPEYFSMVDTLCVPNTEGITNLGKLGHNVKYLPHSVDLSTYDNKYDFMDIPHSKGEYVFYTIGTSIPRKNLDTIMAAYYSEFDPSEPASLIIKTSQNIDDLIVSVQNSLKMYSDREYYKKIVTITRKLNNFEIFGLHQTSNCYINVSSGESWCIPLVDAVGFGNSIITINEGGPKDIIGDKSQSEGVSLLDYTTTWCKGHTKFPNFQDGRDSWKSCDFDQLKAAMRFSFENRIKTSSSYLDKFSDINFFSNFEKVLN